MGGSGCIDRVDGCVGVGVLTSGMGVLTGWMGGPEWVY